MAITEADVRFRASQRMTDFADGGGRMSTVVVTDGQDNNVFDDITDVERLQGRLSLRKVFGAVLNAGSESYRSAHVFLDDGPDDVAADAAVFSLGSLTTERSDAVAAIEAWHRMPAVAGGLCSNSETFVSILIGLWGGSMPPLPPTIFVGQTVRFYGPAGAPMLWQAKIESVNGLFRVDPGGADYVIASCGLDRTVPPYPTPNGSALLGYPLLAADPRPYGVGVAAAGATGASVTVGSVYARVVPFDPAGSYPTINLGIDPAPFAYCDGKLQMLRVGDSVLVHHTESLAPAAVSNGQTVNTGRTGLARLLVTGNNGVVHARFTLGQPAPIGVGCTADLAAGTVTFSDVSGMSQPVAVQHRIEEMVALSAVNAGTGVLTLNRNLSRAYPAGTKVSSLLMLGDLQGRTQLGFSQLAWTGVWDDTRIGGDTTADFNLAGNPIACTNAGSVTERWACIFTNNTTYRVIGESLGEIGTGSTGADYAPTNPATGAPYFTIPAAGWGGGWAAGNVWRFNTAGANSAVWAARCVAPSVPTGTDSVTLQLRGYVNA